MEKARGLGPEKYMNPVQSLPRYKKKSEIEIDQMLKFGWFWGVQTPSHSPLHISRSTSSIALISGAINALDSRASPCATHFSKPAFWSALWTGNSKTSILSKFSHGPVRRQQPP